LEGWHEVLKAYAKQFGITKLVNVVNGGLNGQDSIRNGVMDIASRHLSEDDIVVIHDSIRPMVSLDVITDNIRVCKQYGNATTVVPCNTAMLKSEDAVVSTSQLSRDQVKMTQTPQSFHLKEFVGVHKEALEKGIVASVASCTLYVELGRNVYLSKGSEKNLKLTTTDDVEIFKALLTTKKESWLH
jgi:2-C-methyl-D-erythritol 4-phosphate cytidylyltransferase